MDETLRKLKEVAEMLEKKKKIQKGENEPIEEIQNLRNREESLMEQMNELKRQEKEMDLKLKILKKKDELANIQARLDEKLAEDRFYEEKPDKEGYVQLREEKWEREFEELILKLRSVEVAESNEEIDEETAKEQKENITKEIRRLVTIKNKNKAKNRLNKLGRGFRKVTGGIATFSKEMSKFSNEMGKFGDSVGGDYGFSGSNFDSKQWENFFKEKPTATRSPSKRRKSKKTKKSKKGKKRRKSKKSKTTRGF